MDCLYEELKAKNNGTLYTVVALSIIIIIIMKI